MLDFSSNRFARCSASKKVIMVAAWIIALSVCLGCAPMAPITPAAKPEPPTFSGTFMGNTSDGHPISVSLHRDMNAMTGHGVMGRQTFLLSGLASYCGPIVITFEDGSVRPASIILSADGGEATIQGLGSPLTVKRGGELAGVPSGAFAGKYRGPGSSPLSLALTQGGDLLAGTGFTDGRAVAVVGKVTGPRSAAGTILFSDESRLGVKVILSDDSRVLTLHGLGAPVEMKRE